MLIYHLHVLIILTCSMTSFSDKYCMCYYPCDGPNSADLPLFGSFLQHFFSALHCIEKLLYQLAPSGRFSSTSGRLSVLERFTDSFQVPRKGRSINRPDDVVYRPDAYLRKARIVVQNEPSGHLTAVIRTLVHHIW
jgi:hypothetical protein